MKMKIEKVDRGFILTFDEFRIQAGFEYPQFMQSSFKAPREKIERKVIFEEWNEAQKYIRKHFGVTE